MARDPKRIRPLLNRIAAAWERVPDLRLGQLILDASADPFYTDDEELVEEIEALVNNSTAQKAAKQ